MKPRAITKSIAGSKWVLQDSNLRYPAFRDGFVALHNPKLPPGFSYCKLNIPGFRNYSLALMIHVRH